MRAERRDANEAEIIAALREAGCEVWQLCAKEPADLLVFDPQSTGDYLGLCDGIYLLEVKDSAKPPSARKLTPKQVKTHAKWPVIVISTVEEALLAVRGGV